MSNNVKVAVVGAGSMGKEYSKVLRDMGCKYFAICNTPKTAKRFREEENCEVFSGGIKRFLEEAKDLPTHAIVAVNVVNLAEVTMQLIDAGVKNILLEKPAAIFKSDITMLAEKARDRGAKVYIAYNRRFYSSVRKAMEIIQEDGGVMTFCFEFTEWSHVIGKLDKDPLEKENWFLANSSHVCDLAFFLGGFPREMTSYVNGSLDWHKSASMYAGAGISEKGALFSYCSNWAAPGRWGIEICTAQHRLYLRPMEELSIQDIGSIRINEVQFDDQLDVKFKPGLYREVDAFINGVDVDLLPTLEEQRQHFLIYEKMEKRSYV